MHDPDAPSALRLFFKNIPIWAWVTPAVVVHLVSILAWLSGDVAMRAAEALELTWPVLISAAAYLVAPWAVRIMGALHGASARSGAEAGCAGFMYRVVTLAITYLLTFAILRDLWG